MRKQYSATLAEAVDANFELADELGTVQKWKWTGVVCAAVLFAALLVILDESTAKIFVGAPVAILYLIWWLSSYKRRLRRSIRKSLVKARGSEGVVDAEFTLSDTGLTFSSQGIDLTFSWDAVRVVEHTADAITVRMNHAGIAMIPTRIFDDEQEQEEWAAFIDEATQAHVSSNTIS